MDLSIYCKYLPRAIEMFAIKCKENTMIDNTVGFVSYCKLCKVTNILRWPLYCWLCIETYRLPPDCIMSVYSYNPLNRAQVKFQKKIRGRYSATLDPVPN